ncbi:MAG: undecaprenyl-diphosphate phosphatase, partial [Acidobacteria bacterium]|nr:undecaprenyl-diphosphate phosphatase [Acidobacteriota bacterium]
GIIQGATEFLPVSSSAHLTILGAISRIREEDALPFFIILHLGTLIALLIFFFKDIFNLGRNVLRREKESVKTIFLIILTTFFTGILGIGLKKPVEKALTSPLWASIFLLFTSGVLFSTLLINKQKEIVSISTMTYLSAILIGIAQGIAVFPGISRSGITIVTALFLGLSRKEAFNYSFLASIPAVGGAFLLDLKEIKEVTAVLGWEILLTGFFISLIVGYLSLEVLKKSVEKGKLHFFGFYTLFAALIGIIVFYYF